MPVSSKDSLNYQKAGVDIDAANSLVRSIQTMTAKQPPGVISRVGGFGALYELPWQEYRQPVLVSGTDGVGTKLLLANQAKQHAGIGIDLVAMCVNDILCHGAKPLFFLDYYATGRLDQSHAMEILQSIKTGCDQAHMALVGGETAELPGMYQKDEYDLAGFSVGMVEKAAIIDGQTIAPSDVVIALASSGPHANGYSLIREILHQSAAALSSPCGEVTLQEALLAPTRIYVQAILALCEQVSVKGIAHITGGGLLENITRILPVGTIARLQQATWQWPDVFSWLQQAGHVLMHDMQRTFNLGVGMVVIVDAQDVEATLGSLQASGEKAWVVGNVEACDQAEATTVIEPAS